MFIDLWTYTYKLSTNNFIHIQNPDIEKTFYNYKYHTVNRKPLKGDSVSNRCN